MQNIRIQAIRQINSFVRLYSKLNYSQFMNKLVCHNIALNRQMLAQLAKTETCALVALLKVVQREK